MGSHPPNVCPYRDPFAQNNEVKNTIHELLEACVMCLSTSPYPSLVVMIPKIEGMWHMCLDFHALKIY